MASSEAVAGAEAILEVLRIHGTEFLFCSPIAAWAPLWEALAQRREATGVESPRYVNCRHEVLAVGLASGFYKATGRAQVVLLATGLGVLNGSMALRTALQERTPMTVLAPDTHTPRPTWPGCSPTCASACPHRAPSAHGAGRPPTSAYARAGEPRPNGRRAAARSRRRRCFAPCTPPCPSVRSSSTRSSRRGPTCCAGCLSRSRFATIAAGRARSARDSRRPSARSSPAPITSSSASSATARSTTTPCPPASVSPSSTGCRSSP